MTTEPTPTMTDLAAVARSVLACPGSMSLLVDGIEHVDGSTSLVLEDRGGLPAITCHLDSPLHRAAEQARSGLLELSSGLPDPDPGLSLVLAGHLDLVGEEVLDDEPAVQVLLVVTRVLLIRRGRRHLIAPQAFRDPTLALNSGYLHRATEHANCCHLAELRRSVAQAVGVPVDGILAAALDRLTPSAVDLVWVDEHGADRRTLTFERPAATPVELGDALRRRLHASIC
ncbi:hypothetical protein [Nocardioides sp.]|uniref:hypothetical protein n=1 Tax=Nocardioides sp. TaxID=35761 RepID=UPI003D13BAF5